MQNAAKRRFWDHTMGGEGGGVVANREPGSYIYIYIYMQIYTVYELYTCSEKPMNFV